MTLLLLLFMQSIAALALPLSRGGNSVVSIHVFRTNQSFAFSAGVSHEPKYSQRGLNRCCPRRTSFSLSPTHAHADHDSAKQKHHPSQPRPDIKSIRKPPLFPGAIPIDLSVDIETCINQIGQTSPTNALLGKPSKCQCRHGFAQAFSLDPMPPAQKIKRRKIDRLNSGLLKLTCPVLVASVDLLEDDGFMKEINSKLMGKEGGDNEWIKCMGDAHKTHAATRKELVFGDGTSGTYEMSESNISFQILQSKLGEHGAVSFLDSGVAGVTPFAASLDVKCLHAWLADYLFRKVNMSESQGGANGLATEHPIGDAVVKALKERGVTISGTDTCHEVCSGRSRRSKTSSDTPISMQVPIPRNKQRRKRCQIGVML